MANERLGELEEKLEAILDRYYGIEALADILIEEILEMVGALK